MCPVCSNNLVEIAVRLGDLALTLHACSACDTRWWDRDGERVQVDDVLDLARSRR